MSTVSCYPVGYLRPVVEKTNTFLQYLQHIGIWKYIVLSYTLITRRLCCNVRAGAKGGGGVPKYQTSRLKGPALYLNKITQTKTKKSFYS